MGVKVKATALWAVTRYPPGGWSESFVFESNAADPIKDAQGLLLVYTTQRLKLGGKNLGLVGTRVTVLDSPLVRPVIQKFDPPKTNGFSELNDINGMAIEMQAVTNTGQRRLIRFAGMADDYVIDGKFVPPDSTVKYAYNKLRSEILAYWSIVGQDRSVPVGNVVSIDGLGNVVTDTDLGLVAGNLVQLIRVRQDTGKSRAGRYSVEATTDGRHFRVEGWPAGVTIAYSGSARRVAETFSRVGTLSDAVAVFRKVGRPFGLPRARKFAKKVH